MRSKRTLPLLLLLLVCSMSVITLYAWTIPLKIEQKISDGRPIVLDDQTVVEQSYLAHFSDVFRVSVQASAAPRDSEGLRLTLIKTGDDGDHQVLTVQGASTIRDEVWIDFDLPPTPDLPSGKYTFRIEQTMGQAVSLMASEQNMYPEGELTGTGGDLLFEIAFNPSIVGVLTGLATQLTAHKPGAFGLPLTYLFLFIGLCTAFGGFTFRLLQHTMEDQRRD